jgi:enoyl-CoA hydratase/carnithine racemase
VAMGYPMKAEEAFRVGLAQWLAPHAEFRAQTTEIAERLPNCRRLRHDSPRNH